MSAVETRSRVTEAELRAEVTAQLKEQSGGSPADPSNRAALRGVIEDCSHPLSNAVFETLVAELEDRVNVNDQGIWVDLRASEAVRLQALIDAAVERAGARCEAVILEELTAAGLAFASEYPDAPRGKSAVSEAA